LGGEAVVYISCCFYFFEKKKKGIGEIFNGGYIIILQPKKGWGGYKEAPQKEPPKKRAKYWKIY